MALYHPFDKVMDRVKSITADTNNIIWSKEELIGFIDEGQEEYCQKTLTLRAEGALLTRENSQIYNLPLIAISWIGLKGKMASQLRRLPPVILRECSEENSETQKELQDFTIRILTDRCNCVSILILMLI